VSPGEHELAFTRPGLGRPGNSDDRFHHHSRVPGDYDVDGAGRASIEGNDDISDIAGQLDLYSGNAQRLKDRRRRMPVGVLPDGDNCQLARRAGEPVEVRRRRSVMRDQHHIRQYRRKLPLRHRLDVSREQQRPVRRSDPQHEGTVVRGLETAAWTNDLDSERSKPPRYSGAKTSHWNANDHDTRYP